jgi:hypothetical protein
MHLFCAVIVGDPKEIRSVYMWGAILIGVVLIWFFVYSAFKRWMNDTSTDTTPGFGLSDMRKLRDEGKISAEEYELTRAKMIDAAKKMTAKIPDLGARQTPRSPRNDTGPTGTPPSRG